MHECLRQVAVLSCVQLIPEIKHAVLSTEWEAFRNSRTIGRLESWEKKYSEGSNDKLFP